MGIAKYGAHRGESLDHRLASLQNLLEDLLGVLIGAKIQPLCRLSIQSAKVSFVVVTLTCFFQDVFASAFDQ